MMNPLKLLKNGILTENPTFVLVLGLCPTLAVTSSAINGIGMGLAATAVLMGSNLAISAIRRIIPDEIRIPAFIVVIAGFVTVVQLLISAYAPALDRALGIFIPLIVVNCIILARAEAFAFKNGVIESLFDGMGMGLGFTGALTLIGSIRELLCTYDPETRSGAGFEGRKVKGTIHWVDAKTAVPIKIRNYDYYRE